MRWGMRLGMVAAIAASLLVCRGNAQRASGVIGVEADLREAPKRIYHAKLEFPVAAGPLTLVYPKWIPGEHSPSGPVSDLTGLHFRANGKEVNWRRDDVDMFAFHCEVPEGAKILEVTLDYLVPGEAGAAGVPLATAKLAVLPWNVLLLYPEGVIADDVKFSPSLRLPTGWKAATGMESTKQSGDLTQYETVSLTTLVDSTLLAGEYLNTYDLSPGQKPEHRLNTAADSAATAQLSLEELQRFRQLVAETGALFGARHYRHYDFLLALSDHLQPNGLEHHESSDNRVPERMLSDPEIFEVQTDLLPHEFFHSWNGKYRRPAGLARKNYQEPMKGDLLWVYEGLTQYYGVMLAARSGFWTPERLQEYLATTAAYLDDRKGRTWRNLEDTAISAQILYGSRSAGESWRRTVDYYEESTLIWLEADTILRRETKGQKSLDDFCRKFHGGESKGPQLLPYEFSDVVAALNEVAPYDWKKFFEERIRTHGPGAPLGGVENSGWKLVYTERMNERQLAEEDTERITNVEYSLGMTVHNPGGEDSDGILDVIPGSPAAVAGIAPGMRLLAVNGRRWTPEILREAISTAKKNKTAIELLTENDDYFAVHKVEYFGGEKYPHLESNGKADVLGEIAKRKAAVVK